MTFDILVIGATGFTGKLVVEYLYNHPQRISPGFTIAISARSKYKLDTLAKTLGLGPDVELWSVDLTNEADVESAVRQSKVVINTVGPFWLWGNPVVSSCARNGIHYVDVSAEPHFILEITEAFDFLANKNDTIIVPSCGFDAVPSDVTVYLSNKTLKHSLGPEASIHNSLTSWHFKNQKISGGSFASLLTAYEAVPRRVRSVSTKPYAFSHSIKGLPDPPERLVYTLPHSSPIWYCSQWPMRVTNRQVVQRSWSLFKIAAQSSYAHTRLAYGDKFQYDECMKVSGFWSAIAVSIGFGLVALALMAAPVRWLFRKIVPQPGDATVAENGFLNVVNVSSSNHTSVRSTFSMTGEAGYAGTARMVSEAALSIVFNFEELPYRAVGGGGVLTPMTAFGDVLINRLTKYADINMETEVVPADGENKKSR